MIAFHYPKNALNPASLPTPGRGALALAEKQKIPFPALRDRNSFHSGTAPIRFRIFSKRRKFLFFLLQFVKLSDMISLLYFVDLEGFL